VLGIELNVIVPLEPVPVALAIDSKEEKDLPEN
jgi:hypothetical protein